MPCLFIIKPTRNVCMGLKKKVQKWPIVTRLLWISSLGTLVCSLLGLACLTCCKLQWFWFFFSPLVLPQLWRMWGNFVQHPFLTYLTSLFDLSNIPFCLVPRRFFTCPTSFFALSHIPFCLVPHTFLSCPTYLFVLSHIPFFFISKDNLAKNLSNISPKAGFSQDFEIGCTNWYFYPFCIIIGCQVSIFSIVNFEILGCPKWE